MNRVNKMTKLSLVSAMSVTGGLAATGTLDHGMEIINGGVMIVATGETLSNNGTATGLSGGGRMTLEIARQSMLDLAGVGSEHLDKRLTQHQPRIRAERSTGWSLGTMHRTG